MGLGTQMIAWREDFCEQLAARGFHVVRFDNRDVGLSTHLQGPPPTLRQMFTRRLPGDAYSLEDMADDTVRLTERLGLRSAHVIGASMGGMIGQVLAARHPDRVRSLVSIMSNTGSRWTGQPALSAYRLFLAEAHRLLRVARRGTQAELKPMRLFHYSISYVTLLFLAVAVDPLLHLPVM